MVRSRSARLIFGKLYFPNEDPLTGTLAAFGTYQIEASQQRCIASQHSARQTFDLIAMSRDAITRSRDKVSRLTLENPNPLVRWHWPERIGFGPQWSRPPASIYHCFGAIPSSLDTKSLLPALCKDEERPWCEYDRGAG